MNRQKRPLTRLVIVLLVVAIAAGACANDDTEVAIRNLPDPTETDEARPDNYRESLPRDAIAPVYDPTFVRPSQVDWPHDELVIGVVIDGEARAYPVGFLTFREMVIDNHRGIPTLVTW